MRILLVEDDTALALTMRRALEREGYDVRHTEQGAVAIDMLQGWPADVILLDSGLPDVPGVEVARRIRMSSATPIIMVTAQSSTDSRVSALDGGADDYVVKPFAVPELLARVRAAARRAKMPQPSTPSISIGDISVDAENRVARLGEQTLELKDREFDLLWMLMSRAGEIVRRDEITHALWGASPSQAANSLHVHMSWLRSKLGDDPKAPRFIETVHGRGFRFIAP
jgi:DNA-binding response OmpR family regulator